MIEQKQNGPLRVDRELQPFTGKTIFSKRQHNENLSKIQPLLRLIWVAGSKYDVHWSDGNVGLEYPSSGNSSSTSVGGTQFRLKSVQGDYITSRMWDVVTGDGPNDVLIAKDPKLRESLTSETIFSTTHNYTFSAGPDGNNDYRADSAGASNQLVTPPWLVNDIIYAIQVNHTNVVVSGTELTWLMVSPARGWTGPC